MGDRTMEEKSLSVSNQQIVESLENDTAEATSALVDKLFSNPEAVLNSFASIINTATQAQTEALSKIYVAAIQGEVIRQANELKSKDEAIRRFNDQVDNVLKDLDMENQVAVDNVIRLIQTLRSGLRDALEGVHNHRSLLDKLPLPWRRKN